MKITCQSCASKYTIADEKVAGKTVKIKCKKCGATIVVNGNDAGVQAAPTADPYAQQPAAPDEGGAPEEGDGQTSVFTGEQGGAPGGGDWTVNVADNDQRTMSSAQLAEAYTAGIVNNDTYVWRDGMGDWSPFSDVPELMALTRKSAPAAVPVARPAAGFSPPAPAAPAVGLAGTMMMDQAPPAAAAAPVPAATPAAARRAVQRETADPFQAREQQVAAATPPPKIDRSVGERNENSMLFSISALTAAKDARDHDRAGPTAGGGGGGGRNGGRGGVDDIMNLGGGMAAAPILAPPPLLAPVVEAPPPPPMAHAPMMQGAPPQQYGGMPAAMPGHMPMPEENPYARKKSPVGLIIGIVGGLALVGGALFFFMGRPDPNATTTPDQAAVTGAPTQTAAPTTPTPTPTATQVAAADTAAAPATTGADPGGSGPKPGVGTNPGTSPGSPGPGTGPGPKPSATPSATPSAEPTPAKPVETAPPAAEGAEFNRGAATSALGSAAGAAKGCKKPDGPTGSGRVKVTFAPSGNVTSAVVDGPPFAGTPVGGCVASAFRSARVPPFTGAPVTVSKSFNIN